MIAKTLSHSDYFDHISVEEIAAVDSTGRNPLHWSVVKGNIGFVRKILQRAPQLINSVDSEGNTPLIVACRWDIPEVNNLFYSSFHPINVIISVSYNVTGS